MISGPPLGGESTEAPLWGLPGTFWVQPEAGGWGELWDMGTGGLCYNRAGPRWGRSDQVATAEGQPGWQVGKEAGKGWGEGGGVKSREPAWGSSAHPTLACFSTPPLAHLDDTLEASPASHGESSAGGEPLEGHWQGWSLLISEASYLGLPRPSAQRDSACWAPPWFLLPRGPGYFLQGTCRVREVLLVG